MSERDGQGQATRRDVVPPGTRIEFELVLRYAVAQQAQLNAEADQLLAGRPREPRAEAAGLRAADPADVDIVQVVAERAGLTIVHVDTPSRRVVLSGPAARLNDFFGVTLVTHTTPLGSWREFEGRLTLSAPLAGVVVAVLGLSTKPVAFHE